MIYLEEEKLTSIDLVGNSYEIIDCDLEGINLQDQTINKSIFLESRITKVNFSNIKLSHSTFRDITFSHSKLVGVNWSATTSLNELKFVDCLLDFSVFNGLTLTGAHFENCSLKNCDFSGSNFKGSKFLNCDFLSANFSGGDFRDTDFEGSRNYIIDIGEVKVKGASFSFPDCLSLLKEQGIKISGITDE